MAVEQQSVQRGEGMICDDVLYLVDETPGDHGIFEPRKETQRMVFCQVRSVGQNEFWRAKENGLNPEYTFRLSDKKDYQNEKICVYNGVRYRIVRASVVNATTRTTDTITDGQSIDLTVERATIDANYIPEVNSNG